MSHRLQQRIIKAKTTFPVMAVFALLLWCLGVEWPLDGETSISGWWGELACPVWAMEGGNLLLCVFTVYMLAELNNVFSLIGRRSTLHCALFLLFCAAFPAFGHNPTALSLFACFTVALYSLCHCYQRRLAVQAAAWLFFALGLGSLSFPPILLFAPFFFFAMWVLQGLSPRTFFAGLIGLLLPYWFFFTWAFLTDRLSLFLQMGQAFIPAHGAGYAVVPLQVWLVMGWAVLVFVGSTAYVVLNGYKNKIRTRMFLHTHLWLVAYALLWWVLFPSACVALSVPVLSGVCVLAAHAAVLSDSRMSNVLFVIALLALSLITVSNVWMLW